MDQEPDIDPDLPIGEIMRRWPQTIPVLMRNNLQCIGCLLASFHTIADVSLEHGVDEEMLVCELCRSIVAG